jgi:hypothetical protein
MITVIVSRHFTLGYQKLITRNPVLMTWTPVLMSIPSESQALWSDDVLPWIAANISGRSITVEYDGEESEAYDDLEGERLALLFEDFADATTFKLRWHGVEN